MEVHTSMKQFYTKSILMVLIGLTTCIHARIKPEKEVPQERESFHKNNEKTQELKKRSYMLLQTFNDIDLADLLSKNVGTKIVEAATKVASITEKSKPEDFLKLIPSGDQKNEFSELVEQYSLLDRGSFFHFMRPMRLLSQLQELMLELSSWTPRRQQDISEIQEIKNVWQKLCASFNEEAQKAFITAANQASNILAQASIARAINDIKGKPALTETQRKLLGSAGFGIVRESKTPADIFNNPIIIELEIKDPESANTVFKPLYEGIFNLNFLRQALRRSSKKMSFEKKDLDYLNVAVTAYEINSKIQGVVTKMRNWTLIKAKRSLREVSFHLTQLQETLNDVTDNVGPFKKVSADLIGLCEPVIHDLEALKKSTGALIKKLTEETKAPQSKESPTPHAEATAPAPAAPTPSPTPTPTPTPAEPAPATAHPIATLATP